jgi:hypothetical protein
MNPYVIGTIAVGTVGVIVATSKNKTVPDLPTDGSKSVDPAMSRIAAQAVALATKKETDPNVLDAFGAALKAAGYQNSATVIAAKSAQLKGGITSPSKGT